MTNQNNRNDEKWEDCRRVGESHIFYMMDKNTAKCPNCKQVLYKQDVWVYADDGLEYKGMLYANIINPEHLQRLNT